VPSEPLERRLSAIMFTDIVGSSSVMGQSEAAGIRVRRRHPEIVRPLVRLYHGEFIEEAGDETLSIFRSAVDAVNCALAIQDALREDSELQVRIGLHLGEVVVEGSRVHGDGVNVASRVRALAEPRAICASGEVYHAVRNQPNVEASSMGEQELKNIDRAVAVYGISGTPTAPGAAVAGRSLFTPGPRLFWAMGGAALLVGALSWWATQFGTLGPVPIRSLAVLPLDNLSGDPEQEYFADGMTDALIGDLAKIDDLRVISRTSVMRHKRTERPLPEVAQELEVDAIVEGTVLQAGTRVRITAQLIDARTDQHLWSESYERDMSDILTLQRDVAEAIAREIAHELTPTGVERPVNPAAYQSTLKGEQYLSSLKPADHKLSVKYFERAIEEDPEYAPAYAGLAMAYT
jgi:TolB-like protein/class 3 adenylate cyclase